MSRSEQEFCGDPSHWDFRVGIDSSVPVEFMVSIARDDERIDAGFQTGNPKLEDAVGPFFRANVDLDGEVYAVEGRQERKPSRALRRVAAMLRQVKDSLVQLAIDLEEDKSTCLLTRQLCNLEHGRDVDA